MAFFTVSPRLERAVDTLVRKSFAVREGEGVLLTADTRTDTALLDAVARGVLRAGGRPTITISPLLPFQGGLSDPYVPEHLKAAMAASDVWLDFCFPYHAGSGAHSEAMAKKRVRYSLLAMPNLESFERLFGGLDWEALIEFNVAFSEFVQASAGKKVRFTCPLGTDVSFELGEMKVPRRRVNDQPGMYTVPGTQSFYPVKNSVRGTIMLSALFDEYYRGLAKPIRIEADGNIVRFSGGGAEDRPSFERALNRANNMNGYGGFVHFTYGFHPAAMLTQRYFIEDIRVPGSNAIGMGLPWWEPGGGENHPDGIVLDQSLWVGDEPIAEAGSFVGPAHLKRLHDAMTRRLD
jgi:leucyl aminopeptidase (aminopeptidase T)